MSLSFLKEFEKPGAQYRGKPFWAWNGKLEPEELRRQIRTMHRMGLGGFFMHSRVGLNTPYLSEEWFECIAACVDEAQSLGMEAWLYDEDRWPSGAAGGLVTKNPKHRMRSLNMLTLTSPAELRWNRNTVAACLATVKGTVARDVAPIPRGTVPETLAKGQVILAFVQEVQAPSPWYNDFTYLDTLSHEAVAEFIRVTHEAYRRELGGHFGQVIPGIFSDEPNHGSKLGEAGHGTADTLPWTPALLETFRKRYGYDLTPRLVELFLDIAGQEVSQARYHYHDCVTFLFVDAFGRQIGEWCEANKLQFTGHVLCEDTLSSQTSVVGNCMRFYEHMQAPGMDLLTEHWRVFEVAKQVSSAARQFGRKWRLTETYGCSGWDFPFAGHKALGDWQVALGINLRCQHLAWYTMQGEAKRDYPASIFSQSPWWELYPHVEDYFARIHAVMTRGAEVRDLLVIHPIESMWLQCRQGWLEDAHTHAYDQMLIDVSEALLAGHVDFDYGDEELLSRHAKVRTRGGQAELIVGQATYRAVLVPPLKTMRDFTVQLLRRFTEAGGHVVFAGDAPQYVDALPSAAAAELAAACVTGLPTKGPELVAAVADAARRLSITDASGAELRPVLYLLREDREAYYLFICNTGDDFVASDLPHMGDKLVRERTLAFPDVTIRGFAECAGVPQLLDPETGAVSQARAKRTSAGWEIHTDLPALASRLYVIPKQAQETTALPAATALNARRTEPLRPQRWAIGLSEANNLVLDRPRYRIGEGQWQEATEILKVDKAVHAALGIRPRSGFMVQPWARLRARYPKTTQVTLAYGFGVEALPSGALFLGLEQPATFQVWLNGEPISTDAECGWWTDRSLRKLPLNAALLRLGSNELVLECNYAEDHPGLEIVYLLGEFGARVAGLDVALTEKPATLKLGDWCRQGLPFYSGNVAYRQQIEPQLKRGERLFVRIPEYRGVAVRVLVDGVVAGLAAWEPNEVEITNLVGQGPALLQLEVIGHRRNSHGPHHLNEKWPIWTGPAEYQAGPERWLEEYQLVPCGLMAAPELIVKK